MSSDHDSPILGGQGEELSRSDLALLRQAARQDWNLSPDVRTRILKRLVSYLDTEHEEGATAPDRIVIAAARAVAAFCALSLKQQSLDLQRERIEGAKSDVSLADLVSAAESRAEARKRELSEG